MNDALELKKLFEATPFTPPDSSDVILVTNRAILKASEERRKRREEKLSEADREHFAGASEDEAEGRKTEEMKQQEIRRKKQEEERRIKRAADLVTSQEVYNRILTLIPKLGLTVAPGSRPPTDGGYSISRYYVYGVGEDGTKLIITSAKSGYGAPMGLDRINVSGEYAPAGIEDEDEIRHSRFNATERPTPINISLKKTDDQIVAEIKRRILHKFGPSIEQAKTRVTQEMSQLQSKRKIIKDTIDILGLKTRTKRNSDQPDYDSSVSEYFSDSSAIERIFVNSDYSGTGAEVKIRVKAENIPEFMTVIKKLTTLEK